MAIREVGPLELVRPGLPEGYDVRMSRFCDRTLLAERLPLACRCPVNATPVGVEMEKSGSARPGCRR